MDILLVDDEIYTIRTLQTAINWDKCGIRKVWSALSAARAREILKENEVELILCDIEMPKESGLDLLDWIRKEQYDTEMVFLTSHTDFSYAQKALSLGAYDYCVKPIIVEDIEQVVEMAYKRIVDKKKIQNALEVQDYWYKNRNIIDRDFWRKTLEGRYGDSLEIILKHAQDSRISIELTETFSMVLFSGKFIEREFDECLDNCSKETVNYFGKMNAQVVIIENYNPVLWTALVRDQEEKEFERCCQDLVYKLQDKMGLRVIGLFCTNVYCEELAVVYEKLLDAEKAMTIYQNKVWNVRSLPHRQVSMIELSPQMEQLIYSGEFAKFEKLLVANLLEESREHPVTISALRRLRADLCQTLDVYLKGRNIPAHTLFMDDELCKRMEEAVLSVEHAMRFVHCLVEKIPYESGVTDITNAIKKYIFKHLDEDIMRDSIADALYMNGDYISRVFKKDTGISITQYINRERINQAKQLFLTTDMPVGDVANTIGYTNFSYFSKIFKQFENCSPREFKLKLKNNGV